MEDIRKYKYLIVDENGKVVEGFYFFQTAKNMLYQFKKKLLNPELKIIKCE